jgi:Double zinc ribbon/PilZ domain
MAPGQNFCGGCGAQLKNACPGCNTINPPFFKYCGQCGRNLVEVASVLLDRAGLILAADTKASQLISPKAKTLKGKPFSLYIKNDDLVIFYSHWNELIRSSQRQSVEIELKPAPKTTIHAQIEMNLLRDKKSRAPRIHMTLSDMTALRRSLQDAQVMQDLINLIFSWVDDFHPSQENGREKTIGSMLEKVGLYTIAQYGFISRIDVKEKCLLTDFTWQLSLDAEAPPLPAMPMALMARLFEKLINDRQLVVPNTQTLSRLERKALHEWHQMDLGAILCHVIYRKKTPIGIIGVATKHPTPWSDDAVSLVKLAGRLMAEALPFSRPGLTVIQHRKKRERSDDRSIRKAAETPLETIDIGDIEIIEEPPKPKKNITRKPRPSVGGRAEGAVAPRMKFGTDKQAGDEGRRPVFAGDDGKYVMTCPQCGFQDVVSARLFEMMGSAVRIKCPCGHRFRIIRELRSIYRKQVRLEGYFAQARYTGNMVAPGDVWGPMVVQNLSKAGLKFSCGNAGQLRPGDRLQVRFNLDNANQTLIKKTVIVKSVHADTVGVQFHGTDRYDAALGFYFL